VVMVAAAAAAAAAAVTAVAARAVDREILLQCLHYFHTRTPESRCRPRFRLWTT